jgi:two-component system, cell cycle response regulator
VQLRGRESRGCVHPTNEETNEDTSKETIRILLVGEFLQARGICDLLNTAGPGAFQITQVSTLDLAAERISSGETGILLLDLGANRDQARALVESVRAAAPDLPLVVLSDFEDETLAIESLQKGVQDFLPKANLDCVALARSLRYSIERHRLQNELQSLSLLDDLTGLHNRRGFFVLAGQHLRVILRKGAGMLVYLDVDNQKSINETFGHLEGNRALIVASNLLRNSFRQSDIIARMGGDEFCVLMTDAGKDSEQQVRRRVQQRLDFTNELSSWHFRISFSMGFCPVPSVRQPSLEELLCVALENMDQEKRTRQLAGAFAPAVKQTIVA